MYDLEVFLNVFEISLTADFSRCVSFCAKHVILDGLCLLSDNMDTKYTRDSSRCWSQRGTISLEKVTDCGGNVLGLAFILVSLWLVSRGCRDNIGRRMKSQPSHPLATISLPPENYSCHQMISEFFNRSLTPVYFVINSSEIFRVSTLLSKQKPLLGEIIICLMNKWIINNDWRNC